MSRCILVVEDDEDSRLGMRIRLQSAGYTAVFAASRVEALAQVQNGRPDLILLDLGLPGEDGIEVLRALRAAPGARDTPVIVVTGRDPQWAFPPATEYGVAAFFVKPVEGKQLLAAIRQALEARQDGHPAGQA